MCSVAGACLHETSRARYSFVCLDCPGRDEVQSRLVVLAGSKVFCANPCHAVDLEYLPIINLDPNVPSLESFHAILCLDEASDMVTDKVA
jgi:hypothetical protein